MEAVDNDFIKSLGGLMDVSDPHFQHTIGLSLPSPQELIDMTDDGLARVRADVQDHHGEWRRLGITLP